MSGWSARIVEAKRSFCLAVCNRARDLRDILIECTANIFKVGEDKCLLEVEADGDNVFRILEGKLFCLLYLEGRLEQELLVIYDVMWLNNGRQ